MFSVRIILVLGILSLAIAVSRNPANLQTAVKETFKVQEQQNAHTPEIGGSEPDESAATDDKLKDGLKRDKRFLFGIGHHGHHHHQHRYYGGYYGGYGGYYGGGFGGHRHHHHHHHHHH